MTWPCAEWWSPVSSLSSFSQVKTWAHGMRHFFAPDCGFFYHFDEFCCLHSIIRVIEWLYSLIQDCPSKKEQQ